jgi:hypothetical protein
MERGVILRKSAVNRAKPVVRRAASRLEVLWNPVNTRVKTWEGEAPAEPPYSGPRCVRLPAFLRSSRDSDQRELRSGMAKQRRARIVFLKHRGHRGHRDFGRNPVNSARWANGWVVKVRTSFRVVFLLFHQPSFALPAPPAARKSTPLLAGPASDKYHMPDGTRGQGQGLLSPALTGQRYSSGFLPFVRERLTFSSISPISKVRHCLAF